MRDAPDSTESKVTLVQTSITIQSIQTEASTSDTVIQNGWREGMEPHADH